MCMLFIKHNKVYTLLQTMLDNLSKEVGSSVKIGNFLRMEVGEGNQR